MSAATLRRAAPLAAALLALAAPADAGDDGGDDPILRAMRDEMERAKTLSIPKMDKPYWLCAFVNDSDSYSVSASFGAVTNEGGGKGASMSTRVRVGGPDLDQTNFSGDYGSWYGGGGGGGAPIEADYDALRQALWLNFDTVYKSATETIAKKRAWLTANTVKERQPDFADAKVEDLVKPRAELKVDKAKWKEAVRKASAVFREYPSIQEGSAWASFSSGHQYFLSSDPGRHRFGETRASFALSCDAQAADGMPVSLSWNTDGRTEADLPDAAGLVAKAHELARKLEELAKAPTAEDYWGPVLLTGDAACTFFLQTIGAPLSDPRQDLGNSEGGRLVDRLGRRIAARFLAARDDPTQTEWQGKPLLGSFPVDDDGVLPQPISLIEAGVLKTYYMSRVPTKLVAKTNGHCRGNRGAPGNLFVEGRESLAQAALEKKLLEMCAEEDLEYGIVVEDFGSGGYWWGGGDEVNLPAPSLAYRLHRDGRRELVRGATFKPVPHRVLKDLAAVGDAPHLMNTSLLGQHVSVVAPSVLVEEMELRRPQEEFSKPPYSERPRFGQ